MAFNSLTFLVFLCIVLAITRLVLRTHDQRKNFLLVASYYFYMNWDWRFAGLIFAITIINFVFGPRIAAAKTLRLKRIYLTFSVVGSLSILAYFKYANFFVESMNILLESLGFGGELPMLRILLPVGVCF